MKHGTHWNFTTASGVDNWTLVKTATFSKRASGEVLLRAVMSKQLSSGDPVSLALKVESDKGVEYEIPYQTYGYQITPVNLVAIIDVIDVLWLKVYVKNNSITAGGVSGSVSLDSGGLWFDREVNDISWV